MRRRAGLMIALGIVFFTITTPVSARTISFESWQVTVTVCTNGFTVVATGGTTAVGITTSVTATEAKLVLPNDRPPFIQTVKSLPFTSATGSPLIASASNPNIKVIGTGRFYFKTPVNAGATVQTTVEVHRDGAPLSVPGNQGLDVAKNCTVPPPPVQVNDLSGALIDPMKAGDTLWGDGRAWPAPTDQVIIYCLSQGPFAGTIVVNAVNPGGNPYRLGQFSYNEVSSVRPKAISQPALGSQGELSLSVNERQVFLLEWTHGPRGPMVVKAFVCAINKAYYNKTADQLKYPDAFGNDGRVAPYPTDKLIVYCRTNANIIEVWAADFQSHGYPLTRFNYAEVLAAIPGPVIRNVPGQGSVALQVDFDDNFFLKWTGGPWKEDQIKAFKCRF